MENLYPKPVSLEATEKILNQMKNSICRVILENGKEGSGFFVKFHMKESMIYCLYK